MSSRLIIALIIMLLAPGVQAHNFVTGKTVTPVYIQEGGELLLNSDDEIHYQKWNSTQLAGKVRIIQYIAGRKSAKCAVEIVIPRSLSSGALSILAKSVAVLPATLSDRTFVIAAVKVVLPWSTCPMVPMLQCGFVLSNLAFAILKRPP